MNYYRAVHKCDVSLPFKRHVMIDGGYNVGQYSEAFLRKNPNFEVYAFEPVIMKTEFISDKVTLINKALWTTDCKQELYLGDRIDTASLNRNSRGTTDRAIQVECIDSGKWILSNFSKDDYVHLKLDVEGSECDILENMINNGAINLISELVCEWHARILRRESRPAYMKRKDNIMATLKCLPNIRWIQDWK